MLNGSSVKYEIYKQQMASVVNLRHKYSPALQKGIAF